MPLSKRIIPCLDVQEGSVVKGVKFNSLSRAGDPVELAKRYSDERADELVFLDISASMENRKTMLNLVNKVASVLSIPFTVGGGISTVADARKVLSKGADKVSVNTAAVNNPKLISELSAVFGQQCVVLALDAKRDHKSKSGFSVSTNGGTVNTGLDALRWAKEAERRGAGEILLTSIDRDGTREGFDSELTHAVCSAVSLPVVASGGCGCMEDFYEILSGRNAADAALAASVFHRGELRLGDVKAYLRRRRVCVRM